MMRSGRFLPLPFSRATMFERFGSSAKTCEGMPFGVEHLLEVVDRECSFPGGLVVSSRSTAW